MNFFLHKKTNDITWISYTLERLARGSILKVLFFSVFIFGFVPNTLFILHAIQRREHIQINLFISIVLALIWVNLAPFMIWYYEQRLLPIFYMRVGAILPDSEIIENLKSKYKHFFSNKYGYIAVPWIFLMFIGFLVNHKSLEAAGFFSFSDPSFWICGLVVVWASFLNSLGFNGILTTLLCVNDVARQDIRIDPYDPDRLGGLSCIGYYAIGSTILFSTGSLFLPLIFNLGMSGNLTMALTFLSVSLFSIFILASFLWPTLVINRKAIFLRNLQMDELRNEYYRVKHKLCDEELEDIVAIRTYMNLEFLSNKFKLLDSTTLYPFKVIILLKLAVSVSAPFISILMQKILG